MTDGGDVRRLRRWLTAQRTDVSLLLACAEHPDIAGWLSLDAGHPDAEVLYQLDGCVAETPPAVLLELRASGAAAVTVLSHGCSRPEGARRVVEEAAALLIATRNAGAVRADPGAPAVARRTATWRRPRTRRWFTAQTVPVPRRALLGLPVDSLAPVRPGERGRTVDVLRELVDGDAAPAALDDLPSGAPRLDAGSCAGSGVCVRACPVDALTLGSRTDGDGDEWFELSVDASACTDCGACLELCPEQALSRRGAYSWGDLVASEVRTLKVGAVRRCTRCRAPHARPGDLCPVCAFRRANPFGSSMPPGRPVPRRGTRSPKQ